MHLLEELILAVKAKAGDRLLLAVDSTGRRNSVVKALGRGRVSQSLSGALVQLPSDYNPAHPASRARDPFPSGSTAVAGR